MCCAALILRMSPISYQSRWWQWLLGEISCLSHGKLQGTGVTLIHRTSSVIVISDLTLSGRTHLAPARPCRKPWTERSITAIVVKSATSTIPLAVLHSDEPSQLVPVVTLDEERCYFGRWRYVGVECTMLASGWIREDAGGAG